MTLGFWSSNSGILHTDFDFCAGNQYGLKRTQLSTHVLYKTTNNFCNVDFLSTPILMPETALILALTIFSLHLLPADHSWRSPSLASFYRHPGPLISYLQ